MFGGLNNIVKGIFSETNSLLTSNQAINSFGNTLDAIMTGTRKTLEKRIRGSTELNKRFGMTENFDDKGNLLKDAKGNPIMETKQRISATDLANSLLYNTKGEFSYLRAGAAGVVPVAGGIKFIGD